MRFTLKGIVAAIVVSVAGIAHAAENGQPSGSVAFGIDGMSNFYLPPPGGWWLVNYTGTYWANRINGPHGENALPGAKLDVEYNVFAFKYLPNTGILGSTWTAFEIYPTLVRTSFSNGVDRSTRYGFADLAIDPFGLAWKVGNVNFGFGTTFTVPTGEWNPNSGVNVGDNHFSWNPQLYYDWFDPQGRGDISVHGAYELNSRNNRGLVTYFNPTGSPYTSGQVWHLEVAAAYNVNQNLSVAGSVVGAYQFTNDKVSDPQANAYVQNVLDGNRYEDVSVGIAVRYLFANMIPVNLTYTRDVYARNKAIGNAIVLRVVAPL
jgi:hypothetical protein